MRCRPCENVEIDLAVRLRDADSGIFHPNGCKIIFQTKPDPDFSALWREFQRIVEQVFECAAHLCFAAHQLHRVRRQLEVEFDGRLFSA